MRNSAPAKIWIALALVCLVWPHFDLFGQNFILLPEIRGKWMERDPLGNVYIINGTTITKYDATLRRMSSFSSQEWGEISCVDVRDPFRILLFYREYACLVVVDNQMSMIGSPISFPDFGFSTVQSVCAATGGGIWIINGMNRRLQLLDKHYKVVLETADISSYYNLQGEAGKMTEIDRRVWIHFPGSGVITCDRFGAILERIEIPEPKQVQLEGDRIYYPKGLGLSIFSKAEGFQYFPLGQDSGLLDVLISPDKIIAMTVQGLRVYSRPEQVFGK